MIDRVDRLAGQFSKFAEVLSSITQLEQLLHIHERKVACQDMSVKFTK